MQSRQKLKLAAAGQKGEEVWLPLRLCQCVQNVPSLLVSCRSGLSAIHSYLGQAATRYCACHPRGLHTLLHPCKYGAAAFACRVLTQCCHKVCCSIFSLFMCCVIETVTLSTEQANVEFGHANSFFQMSGALLKSLQLPSNTDGTYMRVM